MRRFHEIRENPEHRTENPLRNNYPRQIEPQSEASRLPKEIGPTSGITTEESMKFWDNFFSTEFDKTDDSCLTEEFVGDDYDSCLSEEF